MNRTKYGPYRRGLGTLAWGAVTAGRLRRSDRIRQLRELCPVETEHKYRYATSRRVEDPVYDESDFDQIDLWPAS